MPVYRPPLANRSRAALQRVNTKGTHYDFFNYMTRDIVKIEEDFLGNTSTAVATVDARWVAGGAGTAAAYAQTNNGACNLVCSSNGSSLYLGNKNWMADQNCTIVARFTINTMTSVKCEVGFSDNVASATLGGSGAGNINSLASTPTLNTGAADATCVIFDSTSGLTNPTYWRLVGSQASTTKLLTPTNTNTALAVMTGATYQTIALQLRRVAVASEDVDAEFWVNGVSMGVMRGGANTYNTALYPYIIVYSASAARTLTLDYLNIYQQRDMTN